MNKILIRSFRHAEGDVQMWHVQHGDGIVTMHFYAHSWQDAMKMADGLATIQRKAAEQRRWMST
jgi:hypothetical protein